MRSLFVQPSLNPQSGGNLVACWMLEALRDEHRLSMLTWCPPEIDACNRFYGTTLRSDDFQLHLPPQVAAMTRQGTLAAAIVAPGEREPFVIVSM